MAANTNNNKAGNTSLTKAKTNKPKYKPRGTPTASLERNLKCDDLEKLGAIISKVKTAMKMPRVQSDEECRERISGYFDFCAERNSIPLWEELALYLGVGRDTLWDWSKGHNCTKERADMVNSAKLALASIDASLAQRSNINPVVYIFRAKNFFDMKDQQDVIVTPNNPLGEEPDRAMLEERIKADVVQEDFDN